MRWQLLSISVLALTCACIGQPRALPDHSPVSPAATLDLVLQREASVQTLRVLFSSDIEHAGERGRSDGVLLVKKPDQFRLRLLLPLGLTALDYLVRGDRVSVSSPLGHCENGGWDAETLLSPTDLFTAFGVSTSPDACTARWEGSDVLAICKELHGRIQRRLRIDPRNATVHEDTSYDGELIRVVLHYGDYRLVDGVILPHRITLVRPDHRLRIEIRARRYEVNGDLPDELFAIVTR